MMTTPPTDDGAPAATAAAPANAAAATYAFAIAPGASFLSPIWWPPITVCTPIVMTQASCAGNNVSTAPTCMPTASAGERVPPTAEQLRGLEYLERQKVNNRERKKRSRAKARTSGVVSGASESSIGVNATSSVSNTSIAIDAAAPLTEEQLLKLDKLNETRKRKRERERERWKKNERERREEKRKAAKKQKQDQDYQDQEPSPAEASPATSETSADISNIVEDTSSRAGSRADGNSLGSGGSECGSSYRNGGISYGDGEVGANARDSAGAGAGGGVKGNREGLDCRVNILPPIPRIPPRHNSKIPQAAAALPALPPNDTGTGATETTFTTIDCRQREDMLYIVPDVAEKKVEVKGKGKQKPSWKNKVPDEDYLNKSKKQRRLQVKEEQNTGVNADADAERQTRALNSTGSAPKTGRWCYL